MDQINLIHAKGGQGTSVTACALALQAARDGRRVRLDGHGRGELAAILGIGSDGPVVPGLTLGAADAQLCDLVVHDGATHAGTDVLVIRPCYLPGAAPGSHLRGVRHCLRRPADQRTRTGFEQRRRRHHHRTFDQNLRAGQK